MESKTFGPMTLELTEADGTTPHASVNIVLTTQPDNAEQALLVDYRVQMADGSAERQEQQILRRDQVYDLPHQVRRQLKAMHLIEDGAHNPDNHGAYLENALWLDNLLDKINDALGLHGTEAIDLDRFLQDQRG